MEKEHGAERDLLLSAQKLERLGVKQTRDKTKTGPVLGFLMRITGFGRIVENRHKRVDAQRTLEHQLQRERLERRHEREAVDFRHREHALSSVEARERRSLDTQIRRESFERASGRDRSSGRDARPPPQRLRKTFTGAASSTREQEKRERARALLEAFDRSAQDGVWTSLTSAARHAAQWFRGSLSRLFNLSHVERDAPRDDPSPPPIPERLSDDFTAAARPGRDATRARSSELTAAFRRGARKDGVPSYKGSGTKTRAPEVVVRPAAGADYTTDDGGRLASAFNNPLKQPERIDEPSKQREGLSNAFADAATRTRIDEKQEMKQHLLDAFARSAERAPEQRSAGDRGLGLRL
jgi:hypothetical protein